MKIRGDSSCTACDLHSTTHRVCVMGQGPRKSQAMVIGEAPGASEEREGQPFVGESGQILRALLRDHGLTRVYITNAVQCRPPGNKTPTARQVKSCKHWVDLEIERLGVKHILLLGNVPCGSQLGQRGITELRGKPIIKDGITYFPTFHPAYILRNPELHPVLDADIRKFSDMVFGRDSTGGESVTPSVINSSLDLKAAVEDIRTWSSISFDVETSGLDPLAPGAYVASIGLGNADTQYVLPLHHEGAPLYDKHAAQRRAARRFLGTTKGLEVIAQNGKFDSLWVKRIFDYDIHIDFDTMLASYMLNENSRHGLEYLALKYLGVEPYDIPLRIKHGLQASELSTHCLYLAKDIKYTYQLSELMKKELEADPTTHRVFNELTMPMSGLYRDIEDQGFYINGERLSGGRTFWLGEQKRYAKLLSKHGNINWGSPQQVARLLFDTLGLPPIELTKKGARSTSESVMLRLDHPVGSELLGWRGATKQLNTFIDSWNSKRDKQSFIHPNFKIHGTVTGRPSCEQPNLQQTPRDPRIRSIITAPAPFVLLQVDISQAEMRLAAEAARCPGLMSAFRRGEDVHTLIVQSTFGITSPTKEERKKGKAINFGYLYGMGPPKFVAYARDNYGVAVSLAEARRSRKAYFERWSGLARWHDRQRKFVQSQGYVRSMIGRKRRLEEAINSHNRFIQMEAERQAINSPIQGLASDWNIAAALEMHEKFPRDEARLVGTVHDSTLVMVREDKIHEYAPKMKSIMEKPYIMIEKFGLKLSVPMIADVEVGPWGLGVPWDEWRANPTVVR